MKKLTTQEFIEKARSIHGDKYDYSKVEYVKAKIKVCIICPIHGEFWQTPSNHLKKEGCPICRYISSANSNKLKLEEFIEKARSIHGDKYDYSKVEYKNNETKVCIICPIHGEFWQTPDKHINRKHGCQKCGGSTKLTNDECIKKFKQIHNDKYDYSKVEYNGKNMKVCIICPVHGDFFIRPSDHWNGQGCPHCKQSKLEKEIYNVLIKEEIIFEPQYKYDETNLKNSLDFFIPSKNIAIECQGEQHFFPVDFANKGKEWAEELYMKNVERDKYKYNLCGLKNITIFYYTKKNIVKNGFRKNKIYKKNVFFDIDDVINEIKKR